MLCGTSRTISDLKIFHRYVEGPLKVAPSSLCREASPQLRVPLAQGSFIFCPNGTQDQSGQSQRWGRLASVEGSLTPYASPPAAELQSGCPGHLYS